MWTTFKIIIHYFLKQGNILRANLARSAGQDRQSLDIIVAPLEAWYNIDVR